MLATIGIKYYRGRQAEVRARGDERSMSVPGNT
jgi:hypothetical protein